MNWPVATFISVAILSITSLIVWNSYKEELVRLESSPDIVINKVADSQCMAELYRMRQQMHSLVMLSERTDILKSQGCGANWATGEIMAYAGPDVKQIKCMFDMKTKRWTKKVINFVKEMRMN